MPGHRTHLCLAVLLLLFAAIVSVHANDPPPGPVDAPQQAEPAPAPVPRHIPLHPPLTDADIDQAIANIKDFLFRAQHETGAWYGSHHTGPGDNADNRNAWGPTAIATLALLESGESPQRNEIRKALEVLEREPIIGIYSLSMRTQVWAELPDRYRGLLNRDYGVMLHSTSPVEQNQANFNYFVHDAPDFHEQRSRIDNSTTQYGVISIWHARKRGLNIPMGLWQAVADGFLTMQQRDGGWSYSGAANTTQSMSLAGLTCMLIAQQELYRREARPNEKVKLGIDNGLAYLDRNYDIREMDNHGSASYAYMGYARIMALTGRSHFGEHDAYEEIARKIIERRGRHGDSIHAAAFDLMFLVRGRAPIWINKLEVPSATWNNRPNDIYFLNQFIGDHNERDLAWQSVNLDQMPTRDWHRAPLAWFSSDGAFQLTANQTFELKRHLEAGGTLIFNAEGKSQGFRASVALLAEELFPDLAFEPMPVDHPMANRVIGPERPERRIPIQVLRGGGRVLMILPDQDWGLKFQAEDDPEPDRRGQEHWRFITNIFAVTTDDGAALRPRLPAAEHAE